MNIKDLTLEEKLTLLTGFNAFTTSTLDGKLKKLVMCDASNGLRYMTETETLKSTAYPSLSVLANTWNKDLAYLEASSLADDCIERDVDVLLGPGLNIKRTPLCGRNFEYFSEDPYLTGTLAKYYINGLQDKGIGACVKHFAVNSREFDRFFQSSDVAKRPLYEIYTRAFKIAMDAKPWMTMCSYNPVNGVFASENKKLLNDMLRKEYHFDGLIVSDWSACHNRFKALKATLDLEMPYRKEAYDELVYAYNKGLITDDEINYSVSNFLTLLEKTINDKKVKTTTVEDRHNNTIKIAEEGIVLLKNEDNILPIKNKIIKVIGKMTENPTVCGGGSAFVTPINPVPGLAKCLGNLMGEDNVSLCNLFNNDVTHTTEFMFGIKEAVVEAYESDVAIIGVGTNIYEETESLDRHQLKLSPNQELFIKEIAKANPNTVVVIYAGSAIDMTNWIDDVKGVIYAGYAGEGVNDALANIICGKVVPSGKLNETFPLTINDTLNKDERGNGFYDSYKDGLLVGYRYFDTKCVDVQFPFGYGLSYADFEYSNLKIEKKSETDYEVSYDITNNSDYDAKEISQIYVKHCFPMVERPLKELKEFSKDLIKAHSTKTISIALDQEAFNYYSEALEQYYVENGYYEILVGSSSKNIKLKGKVKICLDEDYQQSKHF